MPILTTAFVHFRCVKLIKLVRKILKNKIETNIPHEKLIQVIKYLFKKQIKKTNHICKMLYLKY